MKCLGCGELPEHPRYHWSARQMTGPVLRMATRTVRVTGPQMQ